MMFLYTNNQDKIVESKIPSQVKFTPFRAYIKDNNQNQLQTFEYDKIVSYERVGLQVDLAFLDVNGRFAEISLESENDSKQIYSWINDICELIKLESMLNCMNIFEDPDSLFRIGKDVHGEEIDLFDITEMQDFDDIETFNTILSEDDVSDEFEGYNFDIEVKDLEREEELEGGDSSWRLTLEGLVLVRSQKTLGFLQKELSFINENLEEVTPESFFEQVSLMEMNLAQFSQINFDDSLQNQFANLIDSFHLFVGEGQKIVNQNLNFKEYTPQLHELIDSTLTIIPPTQTLCLNVIEEMKTRSFEDDTESPAINDISPLSFQLVELSSLLEDLVPLVIHSASLSDHYRQLNPCTLR